MILFFTSKATPGWTPCALLQGQFSLRVGSRFFDKLKILTLNPQPPDDKYWPNTLTKLKNVKVQDADVLAACRLQIGLTHVRLEQSAEAKTVFELIVADESIPAGHVVKLAARLAIR